jgi:hypothetical protein
MKAVLAALRGDLELAATLAAGAERVHVPRLARILFAIVQMARGLAALGQGRNAEAYQELRRMFDPSDPAYHPVMSYWAIADLAEAASRSGQPKPPRAVVDQVAAVTSQASSRWTQIGVRLCECASRQR